MVVETSPVPSICVPPWAGGDPLRWAPLDVARTRQPPVGPRGPRTWKHVRTVASLASALISSSSSAVAAHVEKEGTGTSTNCSASCGTRSDARCGMVSSRVIVGTSITCSATTGSVTKNWTTSDNWSTICNHRHGYEGLDDRLHGAAQNPCLRASHLRQRWRPTPAELLIKDVEELYLPATGCLLAPWGVVLLVLHQLLLQRDRTARGVVELFSQGPCDARPFVPKQRTEASLPPPPCGA